LPRRGVFHSPRRSLPEARILAVGQPWRMRRMGFETPAAAAGCIAGSPERILRRNRFTRRFCSFKIRAMMP
jgi:hypothetical protein